MVNVDVIKSIKKDLTILYKPLIIAFNQAHKAFKKDIIGSLIKCQEVENKFLIAFQVSVEKDFKLFHHSLMISLNVIFTISIKFKLFLVGSLWNRTIRLFN